MIIRTRVLKKHRPLVDWRDPLEVCGAIAGVIGIAVVLGLLAGLLR